MLHELIHKNFRFEKKFKTLDDHLKNISLNFTNLNTLNEDILYLKSKLKQGNLKKAVEDNSREINEKKVETTIKHIQNYRNSHYKNIKKDIQTNKLVDIIDGKTHYFLKDKLYSLNDFNENKIGSLNNLDDVKYVLNKIEKNKYLQNNSKVRNLKEKVERKLKNYIINNEDYYNKQRKDKKKKRLRNKLLTYGLAASIFFSGLVPGYFIGKSKVKETTKIEYVIKKEEKKETAKFYSSYKAIVDKSEQKMYVMGNYNNSWEKIKDYSISTGINSGNKLRKGDHKTPEGNFKLITKEPSNDWKYKGKYAYGPYFLRLNSSWGDIGLHGTNEPEKLGSRASKGCIRMNNNDLLNFINNYFKKGMEIKVKS